MLSTGQGPRRIASGPGGCNVCAVRPPCVGGEGDAAVTEPDISEDLPDDRLAGDAAYGRMPGRSFPFGLVVFVLGFVCGIPIAMFAPSMVADYGQLVITVILSVLFALALILSVVFALRDRIWRWLFRRSEIELSRFAGPLSDVAKSAAEGKVDAATDAARTFAEIALARYAWVSTRRWLIGSITGLIASIAALAGSALLFEQNRLLRQQQVLLDEQTKLLSTQTDSLATQTARMEDQTGLLRAQGVLLEAQTETSQTQTQLAEAERNSQIGQYVIEVATAISSDRQAWLDQGRSIDDFGLSSLSAATRGQIVAATLVARPYKYLAPDIPDSRDLSGSESAVTAASIAFRMRGEALKSERQRAELSHEDNVAAEQFAELYRQRRGDAQATEQSGSRSKWLDMITIDDSAPSLPDPAEVKLIDRPTSPERGDILALLVGNAILETEELSFQGADFSFAEYRRLRLPAVSFRHALLNYATFDWTEVVGSSFRAAVGESIRFRNAVIVGADFSSLAAQEVRPPFGAGDLQTLSTRLTGADFSDATVVGADMNGILGLAMKFDDSALYATSFANSQISASRFTGAIIHDVEFSGASLRSVDFEGALVFDPAFIERLAREAEPGSFVAGRWALEEVPVDTYFDHPRWPFLSNHLDDAEVAGGQVFRIRRLPDP